MGRKRLGPAPWVSERNRQFARHLNRLLSDARLDPKEFAVLLGRTEVLVYKYLQGVHLPKFLRVDLVGWQSAIDGQDTTDDGIATTLPKRAR